jgi:hypothetical protein
VTAAESDDAHAALQVPTDEERLGTPATGRLDMSWDSRGAYSARRSGQAVADLTIRFIGLNLPDRAREAVAGIPRDLLARTAAFLLLKDSRSSYAIYDEAHRVEAIYGEIFKIENAQFP